MQMICRKCKRIVTINELAGYACGQFTKFLISAGLAAWLAQSIKDYFSNPTRGVIDETMAGACNGLHMSCPQCKETSTWDPIPEIKSQKPNKSKSNSKTQQIKIKKDSLARL